MAEMQQSFEDVLSQLDSGDDKPQSSMPTVSKKSLKAAAPEIKAKVDENKQLGDEVYRTTEGEVPKPRMIEPPAPPKVEYGSPMEALQQMGPMLAIWGSLGTRKPMTTAMSAFANAVQSQQKGDVENYKLKHQEYQDNLKHALEENKQSTDIYKAIIDDKKSSITEKLALIKSNSATLKDPMIAAAAANGDMAQVYDLIGKRGKASGHLEGATTEGQEKAFKDWAKRPENIAAANDYFAGVPVSQLVRGTGKTAGAELQKIKRLAAEIHGGEGIANSKLDYTEKTAESRTLGNKSANINLARNTLDVTAPLLLEKLSKVDPGKYPTINAIKNEAARQNGDPAIKGLDLIVTTFSNDYAALSRRGALTTDSSQKAATELANPNLPTAQMLEIVKTALQESAAIKQGIERSKEDITGKKSSKYTKGQIIEHGSKKYRVIGNENSDDPDVEEVK